MRVEFWEGDKFLGKLEIPKFGLIIDISGFPTATEIHVFRNE